MDVERSVEDGCGFEDTALIGIDCVGEELDGVADGGDSVVGGGCGCGLALDGGGCEGQWGNEEEAEGTHF